MSFVFLTGYQSNGQFALTGTGSSVDIDMPPAQPSAGGQPEASETGANQSVPNQLAILVPSFDPSRDDIRVCIQGRITDASLAEQSLQ